MANETFTAEVVIEDKGSQALGLIARQLKELRDAGESVVAVEEKRERAAANALRRFEALEKRQNALARAEQRRAQQLRDIDRAQSQTDLGKTEEGMRRLERATLLANEQFDETRRRLDGNVTAFERFRNTLDPITQAQRRFAEGQEIIAAALKSGEVSLKSNADVLERVRARLDDQRRSAEFASDDYGKLAQRLNPVTAAEREFAVAISTVNDALARGRIDAPQAKADLTLLRAELEKARAAANETKSEFRILELSINDVARADLELARNSKIVSDALAKNEISAKRAASTMRILEERYRRATNAGERFGDNIGGIHRGIGSLNLALSAGGGLITAFVGSFAVRKLAEFNDVMQQSENRLRNVTDSFGQLAVTQEALFESSQESFTALIGGIEIYERLARSTKSLGIENSRLLNVTEAIQKSVALSGTTALAANAALIQFGQGLAADSLRGQELNSVMEQTPRLARALAEGLGIGIGELRELANQGELTAEKVIKAIESQVDGINREFATIEPTIQQVATSFVNSATVIGDAFGKPIFDELKEGIKNLQDELDSEKTKDSARAFGQNIAAGLDASIDFFVGIRDVVGGAANGVSEFLAKTADAAKEISEQETRSPAGKIIQAIVKAQLEAIPVGGRYFKTLGDIRAEQEKIAKQEEVEKKIFRQQEAWEALGRLVGASADQVRQVREELGLFSDETKSLPTDPLERYQVSVDGISKAFDKMGGAGGESTLEKAKNEAQGFADALFGAKVAAEALAQVAFENVAAAFKGDDIEAFNAAIKKLEERATELREKKSPLNSNNAADIISFFETNFPKTFADDEQRKRIEDFANEIDALSTNTKEASDNFLELALRAREFADAQNLIAAAAFGPDRLKEVEEEIELQKELIKLEADARKENAKFDRAAEEARLRAIKDQEKQIDKALEAFEKMQQLRGRVIDEINDDIGRITSFAGADRRFSSALPGRRQQALEEAQAELQRRRKQFDDVESIALTEEQIDEMNQVFDDAARELRRIFVIDGPQEFELRLRAATQDLVSTLLEDILFNGGKGLGDIFKSIQQQTVKNVLIDPISRFASGESNDLFGDITDALEENSKKFERIGGSLGKVFGDESIGASIGKEVGGALNNFALGSTFAGLFGDSKAGKIGAGAGAIVGQIAELATGIPFLGEAIGALGGIIGGLFGRKTATGTFDFSTGNIDLDNSKKDSRNQERDVVLEQAIQAVQALAQALGGTLRVGTGLEVNVKKSIRTDIVDPRTGQVIQAGGSAGRGDIAGAVNNVLNAALQSVIEGGDERLTAIAKAFAAVDLPAEKLVNSISNLGQVFDYIDGPASQFGEVLDEVVKIFGEATAAAGKYGAATGQLAQQQLDTLQALGGKFDKDTEEATRRLTDPVLQDALDIADEQFKRLKDAQRINDEILAAVRAVNSAGSGFNFPGAGNFQNFFGRSDVFGSFAGLSQQNAAGAGARSQAVLDAQAEAAKRLADVTKLATEEFKAFIRNADASPETFRAVALAIEELKTQAAGLGIDFEDLADELENVRLSVAEEFDDSETKRRQRLENPLAAQASDLIDSQIKIIESARAIGGSQEELSARLQRVFSTNALEIEKFIETAASAPDAIAEVVEALIKLRERADEIGLSTQQIDQFGADAIIGAGDAFLEKINKDFLQFTNDPLARLVSILEAEEKLVETAKKFAELNPARFGGLPAIIQQRNALEREKFLEGLSDAEKLRLGDFTGLLEDYGGRIAVVSNNLRDTLKKNTDDIEKEIDRLSDVFESSIERADQFADARQSITDRFFPGTPLDQFRDTERRLEESFQKALGGDDRALEQVSGLASQFVDQAANVFGGDARLAQARDRALEILQALEDKERERASEAKSQIEILEADLETSQNILKSLESAADNTLYLQQIVDNGALQNKLLQDQIEELLQLRALQLGQNINAVNNLGAITSADQILGAFQRSAPDFSQIDAQSLTTLVQSAVSGAAPNFSFAQTSFDVAAQIADLMALARQSAPSLNSGSSNVQQASANVTPTQNPTSAGASDVVLAIGALEQTIAVALRALIAEVAGLKGEIRVLRTDNQRLNNELKATYRVVTLQ